jgi:AraC-like DNA-binding protein/mannose-6-phosphate isomerase-like protein (cupin superfamily)
MQKPAPHRHVDGQRLSAPVEHEFVSEVLQVVRFGGAFICREEIAAPWGFEMGGRDFGNFYILLNGEACLEVGSGCQPIWLSAGDLVVLPRGNQHAMRDSPRSKGGNGEKTLLLFGGFQFEDRSANPLLSILPDVIHLQGRRRGVDAWVLWVLDFLKRESAAGLPGAEVVITRLADFLFIEALRAYFELPDSDKSGLSVALRDPRIGSALAFLNRHPESDWSLATLSRQAGMSRTSFATRFAELVGEPPMRYLMRCRVNKAAKLLRDGRASVQQVAERVGYDSELGFSRAFKRLVGSSPAEYRRTSNSVRSGDHVR